MKINPLDNKSALTSVNAERRTPAGADGASPGAEPSAKVELSAAGALLAGGVADASFDAQKVARLARAIRDGTFQVDANAIADKLIANARELLGRTAE
jgi:negative regulator of flagellin synthesis FlgM